MAMRAGTAVGVAPGPVASPRALEGLCNTGTGDSVREVDSDGPRGTPFDRATDARIKGAPGRASWVPADPSESGGWDCNTSTTKLPILSLPNAEVVSIQNYAETRALTGVGAGGNNTGDHSLQVATEIRQTKNSGRYINAPPKDPKEP